MVTAARDSEPECDQADKEAQMTIDAVNPDQLHAFRRGDVPAMDLVADGVWSIPNSMPFRGLGLVATFCYAVEDAAGALHLIDPGSDHDEGVEAVREGIAATGHTLDDVATVTATHFHPDHMGLVPKVCAASGASFVLSVREQCALDEMLGHRWHLDDTTLREWGVPASRFEELLATTRQVPVVAAQRADILVRTGDVLPIPGRSLRVLETPGHTSGSVSIIAEDERLVFTGDTVLPAVHPGIGLGGAEPNPVADYLGSLRALGQFDDCEVCPGHEYRFTGLRERTDAIAEHHLRRSREVAVALGEDADHSVWHIASRLHWTAGFDALRSHLLSSALMQTVMHIDFVQSAAAGDHLGAPVQQA